MKTIYASLLFLTSINVVSAQQKDDSTRWVLEKYIHYWGIDKSVPDDTLLNLTNWLDSAENQSLSSKIRVASYQKLYTSLLTAFQDPDANQLKQQLPIYSNMSAFNNIKLSWPKEPKKLTLDNQLPSVKKVGTGSIDVIAIAAPSFDGREFQKITETFNEICTFWIVTLPGAGGVAPYKLPLTKDITSHAWLSNIVAGIQDLVKKEKIKNFYLLTHSSSIALTMLISETSLKNNIRGAVSLNSRISGIQNSKTDPSKIESTEEKKYRLNHHFSFGEIIRNANALEASFSNKEAFDIKMVNSNFNQLNSLTSPYIHSRYHQEANAVDINDYLYKITYPLLIINVLYDDMIPVQLINNNRLEQANWQKAKIDNPGTPLYLSFISARDFFFFENSNEINRQLFSFINKDYSLFDEQTKPTTEVMPSPASSITQTFSNTDITVRYARPAVKNRAIFGTLIPYGKLWRAGANAGTEVTFTRDVKINGNILKSGSYSLFLIPEENEWTFIFNKIINQWGISQYSDKFDALRIKVKVDPVTQQERLTYAFENLTDISVDLSLAWDTKKAVLNIEETFTKPQAETRIINLPWKKISYDTSGDIRNKNSADGKALSYYYDKKADSLWFKFETYSGISQSSPAISISLDTDNNQSNGVNWYGTNNKFKVDLMISLGVTRQGADYTGFNGITDATGIQKRDWINVKSGCVKFFFDQKGQEFYISVKKSDFIKPDQKKVNLIGSVGANATWNDDIGKDGTFATLEFD